MISTFTVKDLLVFLTKHQLDDTISIDVSSFENQHTEFQTFLTVTNPSQQEYQSQIEIECNEYLV